MNYCCNTLLERVQGGAAADCFMRDALSRSFEGGIKGNQGNGSGCCTDAQGVALEQKNIVRVTLSAMSDDNVGGVAERQKLPVIRTVCVWTG